MATGDDGENKSKIEGESKSFISQINKDITDVLESNTKGVKQILKEMDTVYSDLAKQMGLGRESAVAIKNNLGDAYSDVARLGGSMADIQAIQSDIFSSLGKSVLLNKDYYDDLYATQKVTGVGYKEMIIGFKDAGMSMLSINEKMTKVVNIGRQYGLSVQDISSKVVTNMSQLNRFNFKGGVDGLAKMAAQATAMRVEMSTTLDFAEKVYDPEGAIEMASAFQRLGVQQSDLLDPYRLMNLSANDPGELQKAIGDMTKSFTTLDEKGNVKIAPGGVKRLRQIAKETGMAYTELTKMGIGARELDEKMTKIKFPDFATPEQKEMLANITEMKDGEMKINFKGKMEDMNTVLSKIGNNKEEFEKLLESSKPKTMEELAKEQLTYTQSMDASLQALKGKTGYALAGTQVGEKFQAAEAQIYNGVVGAFEKSMNISKMREGFETNLGLVSDSLLKLVDGEGSFEEVSDAFSTAMGNINKGLGDFKESLKVNGSALEKEIMAGNNEYSKVIVKLIHKVADEAISTVAKNEKIDLSSYKDEKSDIKTETNNAVLVNETNKQIESTAKDLNIKPSDLEVKSKTTFDGKIQFDVDLKNAGSNVDKDKIEKMFESVLNNPAFMEKLIKQMENAQTNYGRNPMKK
jgi:hypothetical protein